ncbi:MAG: VirB4 family type IV secretion system protein [Leptospirillum sp.]
MSGTFEKIVRSAPPSFRSFDLWGEEDGVVYGTRGRYGLVFRLSGICLYLKSDETVRQIYQGVHALLHHLPEGWGLQFRVRTRVGIPDEGDVNLPPWCQEQSGNAGFSGNSPAGWYRNDREADFARRILRSREIFLSLVSCPETEQNRIRPSLYPRREFFTLKPRFSRSIHEKRISAVNDTGALLENLLPGCGVLPERLYGPALRSYLSDLLNPTIKEPSSHNDVPPSRKAASSLSEELAATSFSERAEGLVAYHPDGTLLHGRFHALRTWPLEVDRDILGPFLEEADFSHDLVMNLWKPPREKALHWVQSQMTVNRFLALFLPGRSYRLENEKKQQESFLEAAFENGSDGGSPFSVNLSISYWSEDEEDLQEMGQELFRAYAGVPGTILAHEPFRQWPLFLSGLPLQADASDRWEMLLSEHLAPLLPIWDKTADDPDPWFWSHNHLDEAVGLDLWNPFHPNHNGLILGASGSGKSFASKLLMGQFLCASLHHQAIIVENGGDFERLCQFFEGEYLKVDLGGKFSLNPFPAREVLLSSVAPSQRYDPDILGLLGGVIETFISPSVPVGAVHRRILLACIENVYDTLDDNKKRPVLSMLAQELLSFRGKDREDETLSYSMGKILDSWASGIYGDLVNNPRGFDFDGRLVAFDLSALDSHPALKGVVFAFIASLSLFRLKDGVPGRKLYLLFDEAHRILRELKGTEFLSHLYRTVRKWGGGVIAVTQSPEDFLEEDLAAGLLNNTFWKWVFPLANGHDRLLEMGFEERERDVIRTLSGERGKFSEGFLRTGSDSRILRLEASPLAFWLGARSPEEDRIFQETLAREGDFRKALLLLCKRGEPD